MAEPEQVGLSRLLNVVVDDGQVLEQLRTVIDPELGINIVDLGLVYGATVKSGIANVLMTTTTPACPIGSYLEDSIRSQLYQLDGVLDVAVEVTYDPRWSPDMMSDEAKVELGWDR
ncbi:MAG: metal-sulfur cluster assembly factor [Candidatus Limnocylindrales bacterium]